MAARVGVLVLGALLLLSGCADKSEEPPPYTVLGKSSWRVAVVAPSTGSWSGFGEGSAVGGAGAAGKSGFYVILRLYGADREFEVPVECYDIAKPGEVMPPTAKGTMRRVLGVEEVIVSCRAESGK
jgi:hypothetical protein